MRVGDLLLEMVANPVAAVALALVTAPVLPIAYWLHDLRAHTVAVSRAADF